jgi:hypothetical protein
VGTLALVAALGAGESFAARSNQVPVGPRAIGMGGAFSAIADDASGLFWNPAGLVAVGHQEFAVSHASLYDTDLRDDRVSFVLPFSPGFASAVDWYRSGFDDDELGFSENRITVGAAFKLRPWLWAGTGAKLLTRGTTLDGLSVTSGRGFGLDLGLIATPSERWRVGLMAQDVTGTDVRTDDGHDETAYPRNLRLATAYSQPRFGTAAFDVDDRWHAGIEATPHPLLALRAGAEQDWSGIEDPTWSMGIGLKAGFARLDWARDMPPTLASTDHFELALEFNFNPAQVRIEKVEARELYASLYKTYARESFGSVQLRNLQDRPLTTQVGVFIPELMGAPSEAEVTLRPLAVHELPLTAVLNEKVLTQRGDRPVQVEVTASYQSKRLARREKGTGRTVAYGPGAIDWSEGMAQAAAFVTPRDPAVDELARQAGRLVLALPDNPFGNRNMAFAAAMTDALAELGVAYVPDPNNPFSTISETAHAVDTIHYPFETLERLSGDCDDTTVLLASLLGNVGVRTRFVDFPGHIFLLVDTGLHERHRSALGVDSTLMVIADQQVWIPLETTSVAKGFAAAWRDGADLIATAAAQDTVRTVDVTEAQARFEPVTPPGERRPRELQDDRFRARLETQAKTISAMREQYFAARFGAGTLEMEASADALQEVARIEFEGGNFAGARRQLESALEKAPQSAAVHNNLGVVMAAMDSLVAADEHWRAALALGSRNPGIALNRAIGRWAAGDSAAAAALLGPAIAAAGGFEAACRLLTISPEAPAGQLSNNEELTVPGRIRILLHDNVVPTEAEAGLDHRAERMDRPPPAVLIRGTAQYMHWIE